MTKIMKWALLGLLLGALFIATTTQAATWTAASCNASDVQKAINSATAGDTVAIPTGSCTWTSQVSWTAPANVILQGQTTCSGTTPSSCTDNTVIVDNLNRTSLGDIAALSITTNASGTFQMTGITFKNSGGNAVTYHGSVVLYGNSQAVRIDHCHFYQIPDVAAAIVGWIYGVMDHSVVDLVVGSTNNGIREQQGSWGNDPLGVGNGSWNDTTTLGSNRFFYLENNTFNGGTNLSLNGSTVVPFVNDCFSGGRFVVRFNTINGAT